MHLDHNAFEKELKRRGWAGIDGINSMGKCHLNKQHYILTTDGLIIYSSLPFYKNVKYLPNEMEECWEGRDDEWSENVFSWDKLDAVIKLVDEQRALTKNKNI